MSLTDLVDHAHLGPTLALPIECLPTEWPAAAWYTDLTVTPIANAAGGQPPPPVATAQIRDGWLHLPRFRGIALVGGVPPRDRRTLGEAMNPELQFAGALRDAPPQREATARVAAQLETIGGAMLVLPCGFGKTVCGLWTVHSLGRRALVLVHTGALADQWSDRVRTFLPGARVGRIQQDVADVEGCDVVIGMIQSLVRREYPRELLASFGTVVVDEAHHIAAPWFGGALRKLSARYVLGLSATPDRKDGLGCILPWMLGPIAFRATRPDETVHVRMVTYADPPNQLELRDRRGKPRFSEMLTRLASDEARTRCVVDLIMEYVDAGRRQRGDLTPLPFDLPLPLVNRVMSFVNVGRRLIVLSQRRDQLLEIERLLMQRDGCVCVTLPPVKRRAAKRRRKPELSPALPAHPIPRPSAYFTVGRVMGGSSAELRDAGFAHSTVLLSTYPYAAEGIDIPRLDTLIMASPGVNVEQTVGRILRKHPAKHTPLVVDVKDPFSLFDGMAWKRFNYYKSQNYTVETEKYV